MAIAEFLQKQVEPFKIGKMKKSVVINLLKISQVLEIKSSQTKGDIGTTESIDQLSSHRALIHRESVTNEHLFKGSNIQDADDEN